MYGLLLGLHLLVCFGLVAVVLVQSGKGGGLAGGAFGGTAQTVFGGRGATDFITRATMVLGGAFFVTSLVLALLSSGAATRSKSLIQEQAKQAAGSAPGVAPAPQRAPGASGTPQGGAGSGTVLPTTPAPSGSSAPAKGASPAPAPAGSSTPSTAKPPAGGH